MNINVKKSNEVKIRKLIKNLEKRQIEGFYCETKEEAAELVLKLLEGSKSVSWGGSATLDEIGIKERLAEIDIEAFDPYAFGTEGATKERRLEGMLKDAYLMSTNAITIDGVMLNIDGSGNRLAALSFVTDKVIIVAGRNKIVKDEAEAYSRVKNVASPANAIRLNFNTPCAKTGMCGECIGPDSMCAHVLYTRGSRVKGRIKVILVNEELGF